MNRGTSVYHNSMSQPHANPVMADRINENQTFKILAHEVTQLREAQAMRWKYSYHVSGQVTGQQTNQFTLPIESGTDFRCTQITGSAFSYDGEYDSDFPYPNGAGVQAWAGRGLSVQITDSRGGRTLTNGFVPFELLFSPGYGINFQNTFKFRYLFYRNSIIQIDVRNRDNSNRIHDFDIMFDGYKYLTPGQ